MHAALQSRMPLDGVPCCHVCALQRESVTPHLAAGGDARQEVAPQDRVENRGRVLGPDQQEGPGGQGQEAPPTGAAGGGQESRRTP